MKSPRRAAVSILRAWSKGHAYAENLIERHASRNDLSSADRALLNAIVLGVLRHRRLLDHWIGVLRKGKLDDETRDILRVGLCQLLILQLPDHAAVFETVELGKSAVRGLINAVMRRAAVSKKRFLESPPEDPAILHSHPDWLFHRWRKAFGSQKAVELMEFNNLPAPTIARLNPLAPPEALAQAGEILGEPLPKLPASYFEIQGGIPNALLASGAIYIQDPATRHCVELLQPRPGEDILDACAAPGGKSFLIAAALGGSRGLTATDSNEKRLPRLRENFRRLHMTDAVIDGHDWTTPAPSRWHQAFDAILLDVPCSNTGVFRRRVDVRWRLRPQDIEALTLTQLAILEQAVPCLKPGGRIVYSTCSIEEEENLQVVQRFLDAHPRFRLVDTRSSFPSAGQSDGAFAALLQAAI